MKSRRLRAAENPAALAEKAAAPSIPVRGAAEAGAVLSFSFQIMPGFAAVAILAAGTLTPMLACSSAHPPRDQSRAAVIRVIGSDTMVNLVQAWAETYRSIRPAVTVQVAGGGSGVGIAGLIDGTVDLAAASREMRPPERQQARARRGVDPIEFIVALDALAVYVHKDNPLDSISIQQLAEIYGEAGSIVKWSQLDIHNVACPSDRVIRIGRQNNSGTFAYFRDVVLGNTREYKLGSIDQSGSKDVVALVSNTPCAIGYSGIAFATSRVNVLKISARKGGVAIGPAEDTVTNASYPLARPLYFYAGAPGGSVNDFLDWVRGPDGQGIARELGLVPVPAGGWSSSTRASR